MMDERTKQYLIDAAEKGCTRVNCMKEKALKAFEASLKLPSKIVKPMPDNYVPELSSNNEIWDLGRRLRSREEDKDWLDYIPLQSSYFHSFNHALPFILTIFEYEPFLI